MKKSTGKSTPEKLLKLGELVLMHRDIARRDCLIEIARTAPSGEGAFRSALAFLANQGVETASLPRLAKATRQLARLQLQYGEEEFSKKIAEVLVGSADIDPKKRNKQKKSRGPKHPRCCGQKNEDSSFPLIFKPPQ